MGGRNWSLNLKSELQVDFRGTSGRWRRGSVGGGGVQRKRTASARLVFWPWASCQGQAPATGKSSFPVLGDACIRPPASLPSARTRQAWRGASPAGSVRQDAMSFLDEPSSSGNVPGCGKGDSCVPKIQPRSCLPEPNKQRQKQSWQGVHGPSQCKDRTLRASICLGLSPPARSDPSRSHRLELVVPVTLPLPQPESIKAVVSAKCMQAGSLPCR